MDVMQAIPHIFLTNVIFPMPGKQCHDGIFKYVKLPPGKLPSCKIPVRH